MGQGVSELNQENRDFLPLPVAAKATGEDPRAISLACRRGTVPGAFKPFGGRGWVIPAALVASGKILKERGWQKGRSRKEKENVNNTKS